MQEHILSYWPCSFNQDGKNFILLHCTSSSPVQRDLSRLIDHFRITFSLFLKASLGAHPFIWKWDFIHMEMSLICMWMKSHFYIKGWAPRLALRKRLKVIRKLPIRFYQIVLFTQGFRWYKKGHWIPCVFMIHGKVISITAGVPCSP